MELRAEAGPEVAGFLFFSPCTFFPILFRIFAFSFLVFWSSALCSTFFVCAVPVAGREKEDTNKTDLYVVWNVGRSLDWVGFTMNINITTFTSAFAFAFAVWDNPVGLHDWSLTSHLS